MADLDPTTTTADATAADGASGSDAAGTVLTTGTDAKPVDADGATTNDWRAEWAGDDADVLKFLGRFHSREAALKGWKAQNDDIKNGKFIKPLGENPTDAEKAAYRAQLGVPEKPEAYLENLGGLVIGDDDKPIVGDFAAAMHALDAPPAIVKAGVEWYYDQLAEQAAAESARMAEAKDAGIEALRTEWGADYKRNLNVIGAFGATMPEPLRELFFGKEIGKDNILQARMPDGSPVGSNPEVLKWLAGLALDANPLSTVMPGAGANQASAIADELATLENMMGDRNSEYWKGANAPKNRARYLELQEAVLKMGGKG